MEKRCDGTLKRKSGKLRTKLVFSFLLVALLGIGIVGALFVDKIYTFSKLEVERTSRSNLKNAMDSMLELVLELRNESIRPLTSVQGEAAILELLTRGETSYENQFQLQMHLNAARSVVGVHSLFFLNRERVITYVPESEMSFSYLMEKPWFADWYKSEKSYTWGDTYPFMGDAVVPYVRRIVKNDETIGVSVLNISEGVFDDSYASYGNLVVVNEDETVISARDKESLGRKFSDVYGVPLVGINESSSFRVEHNGIRYLAMIYRNENYGIGMLELLPQSSIQDAAEEMLMSTLAILVFIICLCIVLSIALSVRITGPLKKAADMIDMLEMDALAPELPVGSDDEIGMLISSINNMTQRLAASRREIELVGEARRLAEYRAIQLQINPHFLYNTLSSITWFAELGQPENVKVAAESLATLFRISVNHGKEMLRIAEEIKHVRCYLDIQMLRHQGEFKYQIDVDPEILNCYMIKIILQPLVENAVYHGIRENGILNGMIRIVGKRSGEAMEFQVIDNGNTARSEIERMNEVLQNPDSGEDDGIGMLNVHNRIRYFYQGDYGLRYEKQGDLTVAFVELPLIQEAEDV